MRNLAKLLVWLPVMAAVGCSPAPKTGLSDAMQTKIALKNAGLEYYWKLKVHLEGSERVKRVYRLDENVYCLTNQRRLIAVDARSGVSKWSYTIEFPNEDIFRPVHYDGLVLSEKQASINKILHPKKHPPAEPFNAVIINTTRGIIVLDRETGSQVRLIPLPFMASTGGSTDGVYFYVASARGRYHAVHMDYQTIFWSMSTDTIITAPVEFFDGIVYAGGQDKTMCATVGNTYRKPLWRRNLPGPVVAAFHVDRRGCFLSTLDGQIHLLHRRRGVRLQIDDPQTGSAKNWGPFVCKGPIEAPIQVDDKTIFQLAENDKFYAINISDGTLKWTHPDARKVLAVMNGKAVLADANKKLLLADYDSGNVTDLIPAREWNIFVSNTSLPAIYAGTTDGRLGCIRPIGAEYLADWMLNTRIKPPKKDKD